MPSKRPKSQNGPVQLRGFTPTAATYGCHQQTGTTPAGLRDLRPYPQGICLHPLSHQAAISWLIR